MASAVEPLPEESRNLQETIRTSQLTPVTPRALFPTAPMVPDTWVP